ncbi:hypothetical protein OAN83_00775 [Alphaproteobacteria bacterium]|nr:hypothetical protein [Alphaproteobacteria bacterium]
MSNRTISVFSCPTALYDEVKIISKQEMISVFAFCRMAVKSMVQDYRSNAIKTEELQLESASAS